MKNLKELAVVIPFVLSIAILLNLFVYRGIDTVYPEPEYSDFCDTLQDQKIFDSRQLEMGENLECTQLFNKAEAEYALFKMIILIGLATLILAGSRQVQNRITSLGLSYAALFMFIGSLGDLWRVDSSIIQLLVILIALVIVIYFVNKKKFDWD